MPVTGTTGKRLDPAGVAHPKHYNVHPSGVECVEVARHMSFNVGNAFKYLFRAEHKENALKDIQKALWYLRDEVKNGEALPRQWSAKTWKLYCKVFASEPDELTRAAFTGMAEYAQHGSKQALVSAATTVSAMLARAKQPCTQVQQAA